MYDIITCDVIQSAFTSTAIDNATNQPTCDPVSSQPYEWPTARVPIGYRILFDTPFFKAKRIAS